MNNQFPSRETVKRIREQYPAGTRVELIAIDDPYTKLVPGDKGTVTHIDDTGTVFCRWDSDSGLGLVYGADSFKRVEQKLIYETGAEMWRDLFANKGIIAARVTSLSYLEQQTNTKDPKEKQFCRELRDAMMTARSYASMEVYPYSYGEAHRRGEQKLLHDNFLANSMCAGAIYEAVEACENSDGTHRMRHAVPALIEQYGTERLNAVLAAAITNAPETFSAESNAWANGIVVPGSVASPKIMIRAAVLDEFIAYLQEMKANDLSAPTEQLEKAAAYILEKSARETLSGMYIISANDIPADILPPELFAKHIDAIVEILSEYGAVLDIAVTPDGAIDITLGLAYCPNYEPFPEEVESGEYPDDREIEDPLATRGENILRNQAPELNESEQNFAAWLSVTESSRYKWVEDEIYRLNGRGAMYYTGGVDGIYMRIGKNGALEAGKYEGAIPHIGEAMFTPVVTKQFPSFNEAYTAAMEAGGKQFLVDMFSGSEPQPLYQTKRGVPEEKPSVLKQIRDAQNAPPPRKDKSASPRKNKGHDAI